MNLQRDPFAPFRGLTQSRIGLGRAGDALPTAALLDLRAAHARAREAVHQAVDFARLAEELSPFDPVIVHSQAGDRATYLRRPDLGRRLDLEARQRLQQRAGTYDVALVIGDGLSASAITTQAGRLVWALKEELRGLTFAPLVLARQARVALGDEIGQTLGAKLVAVVIGERPGLSVSDSLGIYITFDPSVGRRDSERNCISNVHPNGASIADAALQLGALVREARRLKQTGVHLKLDQSASPHLAWGASRHLVEPSDL